MIGRHTESLTGPTRALFARFLRQAILTTESPTGPVNILERKYYGTDRAKMGPFHNMASFINTPPPRLGLLAIFGQKLGILAFTTLVCPPPALRGVRVGHGGPRSPFCSLIGTRNGEKYLLASLVPDHKRAAEIGVSLRSTKQMRDQLARGVVVVSVSVCWHRASFSR